MHMVILPTKEMFPLYYPVRCDCGNLIKVTKGFIKVICYTCGRSEFLDKIPFLMNKEYDIYSYLELHTQSFNPYDKRCGKRIEPMPRSE